MPPAGEELDRLAVAGATARAFGVAAGAERVVLLVDEGEDAPATMLDWTPQAGVAVTAGNAPEPVALATAGVRPLELPPVTPVPATAMTIDVETGELAAPLGSLEQLAQALLALAGLFGGRSVATADFPTREPAQPVTLAGRPGEAVVVAVDDQRFEMPAGWPPSRRASP